MPTTSNTLNLRQKLKDFDFQGLFIEELGWDRHHAQPLEIMVNESTFRLTAVAEKRGMVAYLCQPDSSGAAPDYPTRRKIERQVAKTTHEHIVIYVDAPKATQTWQWVKRELGRPTACREHTFHKSQPGDALIQKLQAIAFSLEEEEKLTITEVAGKAKQAFDVDRVTKRFYDHFKDEHAAFLGFIKGISSQADWEWYASLMLNRLMFIYFIQKKGFLDTDTDYLRHRLAKMQERKGKDQFHTFYRHFLLKLFHEGLGGQTRNAELDALLGKVPYLNGGLFDVHQLEHDNKDIEVPDEAFERLFDFFDAYQWRLDERPLRNDKEINPDVLGYIFEKYINQKQMGAYYTKEDITEYIGKNTVVPFLFDSAEKECAIAFRPESALWRLLRDDPDRYIYEAVRKGVDIPLPQEIAAGIGYVSKRGDWNQPAGPEHALPTETWREHVARRTRCLELRAKLAAGGIHSINDLITYNLNIRQFAQDAIETCEGPELLRAFYHAIEEVTILDPTCGSGAFLFAALNILEPLYQACLDRMQAFVDDLERSGEPHRPEKFSDFRRILGQANDTNKHPNHPYFILKSIVLNNLYGVDIMEEAVEICKLRLFLKLVAQVETADQIEPLPDIDFNIRAGNTLVGFTSLDAVRQAMTVMPNGQHRMPSNDDVDMLKRIDEEAEVSDWAFQRFKESQSGRGMDAGNVTTGKEWVRECLGKLRNQLDSYLAAEYGVDSRNTAAYSKWRSNHQPFHWFVEFYGVIKAGGFDVIIGNPPYVEYGKVQGKYTIKDYSTKNCGNLYAFIVERASNLTRSHGRVGMILALSSICTDGFSSLQKILTHNNLLWISNFDTIPSTLFSGVVQRLSILIFKRLFKSERSFNFSTHYYKWLTEERWLTETTPCLFATITYVGIPDPDKLETLSTNVFPNSIAKVGSPIEKQIINKMFRNAPIKHLLSGSASTRNGFWYKRRWSYFLFFVDFMPEIYDGKGNRREPSEFKRVEVINSVDYRELLAIFNSDTFYMYFTIFSDNRNVNVRELNLFPFSKPGDNVKMSLRELAKKLMEGMRKNSEMRVCNYRSIGTIRNQYFFQGKCKPIIDEIDRELAKHYGFTDEELDFIINYDIKYRMGKETGSEAEEE